jgi:hypothetical protein
MTLLQLTAVLHSSSDFIHTSFHLYDNLQESVSHVGHPGLFGVARPSADTVRSPKDIGQTLPKNGRCTKIRTKSVLQEFNSTQLHIS